MITDKQLADLLGVEAGEEFMLKLDTQVRGLKYRIEGELHVYVPFLDKWTEANFSINELLKMEIIKLPWNPKAWERYYFVSKTKALGWGYHINHNDCMDKILIARGEVYRTQEEAEQAVKELGWDVE